MRKDAWIPNLKNFWLSSKKPNDLDIFKVSNLIIKGKSKWNEHLLRNILSLLEVNAIFQIPAAFFSVSDQIVWHYDK